MSRFLVVCDVDSTLINDEVIELLADVAGVRGVVADITERAMRGELDFAASLRERVATLAGLTEGVFAQVLERITPTPGATELIAAVHAAGGHIIAVSGGFHELLDPMARDWGLDWWAANRLEKINGMLTGRTLGPVIDAAAKENALRDYATEHGIPFERTIAVGDGANDLRMMSAAGLSVAFCAKPIVAKQATVSIDVRDLRQVIPLFGGLV